MNRIPLVLLLLGMCVCSHAQQMTKYEYWFDSDIGNKQTGTIQGRDINLSLDLAAMAEGVHTLMFRAADDRGKWTSPEAAYFVKQKPASEQNKITHFEYWIDNDVATTVLASSNGAAALDIDVNALSAGVHSVCYRFRDAYGSWSTPLAHYFVRPPEERATRATQCEYWIDSDISTLRTAELAGGTMTLALDFSALPEGPHTLSFRTKDDAGKWSAPSSSYFVKVGKTAPRLSAYEYWIDGDVAAKSTVQSSDGVIGLDVDASQLGKGVHTFTFRMQDENGRWSAPQSQCFVNPVDPFADSKILGYQYWFNDAADKAVYVKMPAAASPLVLDLDLPVNSTATEVTPDNIAMVKTESGKYQIGTRNLLHIRFKDANMRWSEIETDTFTTVVDGASFELTQFVKNNDASGQWGHWNVTGNHSTDNGHHWSGAENPYFQLGSIPAAGEVVMEQTISGLPAGQYTLSAIGRASASAVLEMSANGFSATFDSRGDTGGSLWEEAAPGSAEKLVHDGKGYGWGRQTLLFSSNGEPFTLRVKASAAEAGQWASIDDFRIEMTSNTSLGVVFADAVEMSRYANLRLVLTSSQSRQQLTTTGKTRSYSFRGLSSNAEYTLSLQNRYGQEFVRREHIMLEEGENQLSLDALKEPVTVAVAVTDTTKRDVTAGCSIVWRHEDGTPLAGGSTLTDIPQGARMTASVSLSDTLGTVYREMNDLAVEADGTPLAVRLKPIGQVAVNGVVMTDVGAAHGASVSVTQLLNGRHKKTFVTTTDKNGCFALQLYNDTAVVRTSLSGYVDSVATFGDFAATGDLGTCTLKPVTGKVLGLSFAYTPSTKAGDEAGAEGIFTEYGNVDYHVYNKTRQAPVTDFTVQQASLIMPASVTAGDVLEVTAKSRNNRFADAVAEAVVADEELTKLVFTIVERGGIDVSYVSSANSDNVALLYNGQGKLVENRTFAKNKAAFSHLPQGSYKVVTLGSSSLLGSLQSLAGFETVGMVESRDYLLTDISVADGVVSELAVEAIPRLNEEMFCYTTSNTQFSANKSSVVAGNYVTITARIELKEPYAAGLDDGISLSVAIPEGCAYVENSAIIGTAPAPYTCEDGCLTIALTKDNYRERIRFCLTPTTGGSYLTSSILSFDYDGATVSQPLGSAAFSGEDMSINVPAVTSRKTVAVSGMAMPYSEISIYDNATLIGSTNARGDGSWMTSCELYQAYNLTSHPIHAVVKTRADVAVTTESKNVDYNLSHNEVKTVTMLNTAHTAADLKLYEYKTVFDFRNPSSEAPVYWYWPNYPDFTFIVDFENNDTARVSLAELIVYTSNNDKVILPLTYSAAQDRWVATRKFHQNSLPASVAVSYFDDAPIVVESEQYVTLQNEFDELMENLQRDIHTIDSLTNLVDEELKKDTVDYDKVFYYYAVMPYHKDEPRVEPDPLPFDKKEDIDRFITECEAALPEQQERVRNLQEYYKKDFDALENYSKYGEKTYEGDGYSYTRTVTTCDNLPSDIAELGYKLISTTIGNDVYVRMDGKTMEYINRSANIHEKLSFDIGGSVSGVDIDNELWKILGRVSSVLTSFPEQVGYALSKYGPDDNTYAKLWMEEKEAWKKLKDSERALRRLKELGNSNADELARLTRIRDGYKDNWKGIRDVKGKSGPFKQLRNSISNGLSGIVCGWSIYEDHKIYSKYASLKVPACVWYVNPEAATILDQAIKELQKENKSVFTRKTARRLAYLLGDAAANYALPGTGLLVDEYENMVESKATNNWEQSLRSQSAFITKALIQLSGQCEDIGLALTEDEKNMLALAEQSFLGASAEHVMDPSGYVYEAVSSNRLEGVTVTLYQKESKEDMYGDKYEEITKWDAEAYMQKNPVVTDANGYYAWDVPQGWWQVKYEKDGYETVYSEWLPVPPPQLDINMPMRHAVAPEVKQMKGYESGITVEMSKYMRPESFAEGCISVLRNGVPEKGTLRMVNLEKDPYEDRSFVSRVKFVPHSPFSTTDHVVVTVHKGVESYCGVKLADDCTQTVVIEPEIREIAVDSIIRVTTGQTLACEVAVLPAAASRGKTLYVSSGSPSVVSVDADAYVVDDKGKVTIVLQGNLPGSTALSFSIPESEVRKDIKVEAGDALAQAASPQASVETGSLVAKGTKLTLSTATEGAVIYYTLDGSCPCDAARRIMYAGPIEINENVTLKAIAVKDGLDDSEISTFIYYVGTDGIGAALPDGCTVKASHGEIIVENAQGCSVTVYNVKGETVYARTSLADRETIGGLRSRHVYLLVIRDAAGKTYMQKLLAE